jgi:hypothetical protein
MNIKLKALLQTIGFFIVCILSASLANLLPVYVLGGMLVAGMFYLVYNLLLSRLEFDKKVEDIVSK